MLEKEIEIEGNIYYKKEKIQFEDIKYIESIRSKSDIPI